VTGRQALALGVAWPEGIAGTISLVIAVATVIVFTRQTKAIRTSVEARARVRAQLAAQPAIRVLIHGITARIVDTAIVPSAPNGDHHHLDEAGPGDETGANGRARGRL
jgi:hypothetical protein